ncbi:glycosyl transferase family 1 [Methanosarcina mazei]|uniref:Glycosyl transferase family 1 n=2 Tax=Methanosarcina mazei TaxID=2209 RepID=A0A0F8D370_METMZ|nr:glycosyl transferase family 1 [Methanosarcina mazei]
MKIVHVAEWSAKSGGGFTAASNLVNSLLKINPKMDIHIVSFGDKNAVMTENGYTLHFIKLKLFPTSQYWYLPKILNAKILEISPDLVHLHFTYPPYSFITQLTIPVVITVHGLNSMRVKGSYPKSDYLNFRFILYPYFEKKALQRASRIINVSQWTKEKSDSVIGVNSKTVYIPNGIVYEKYSNIKPRDLNHPSIFFAGRLVKLKNVDILIKALSIIKETNPDAHLYIAGSGPQYQKLGSLSVEFNVDKNITFLNFISEDEMLKMYASVDIFALPSKFENCPMVLLEALAVGTPVVASNVGGIPQILDNGKYGLLAESGNVEDFAQKIITLIKNKSLRNELSEKGKQRVKEYSWDDIASKTIELYSSIL